MLGQLHDAGNTTTLAHYLELLAGAGLLTGLPKFSGNVIRRRASSPKLQVLNTALATAQSARSFADARADGETWGRLVESAVGAHLANAAATGELELSWWREGDREVDFVLSGPGGLAAIEVKSGRGGAAHPGIAAFTAAFSRARPDPAAARGRRRDRARAVPARARGAVGGAIGELGLVSVRGSRRPRPVPGPASISSSLTLSPRPNSRHVEAGPAGGPALFAGPCHRSSMPRPYARAARRRNGGVYGQAARRALLPRRA